MAGIKTELNALDGIMERVNRVNSELEELKRFVKDRIDGLRKECDHFVDAYGYDTWNSL